MARSTKNKSSTIRNLLRTSVSISAMLLMASAAPALAEEAEQMPPAPATVVVQGVAQGVVSTSANPIIETNRYFMRLMTQIFDGSKEFSHTQIAAFARKRQDNISWTMMDFGDGAVVITKPEALAVSGFKNTSKAEFGALYNYDTKMIEGNSAVAKFHNNYVRPQLDRAPALGSDVRWDMAIPIGALGVPGLSGQQVKLELSREYFTHDGKEMVLLQYVVPALRFDSASGAQVVHWGRGFALTDPGFGNIYASAALHRSVADERDGEQRPYRYYRAAFASNNDGKPMVDIKKIPAVAKIYESFFGDTALDVIPFADDVGSADQRPVRLAANIDVMALSIAENGANDGGTLSNAQNNTGRGNEVGNRPPSGDSTASTFLNVANYFVSAADKSTAISGGLGTIEQDREFYRAIEQGLTLLKNESSSLKRTMQGLTSELQTAQNALEAHTPNPIVLLTPATKALETKALQATQELTAAQTELNKFYDFLEFNAATEGVATPEWLRDLEALERTVVTKTANALEAETVFDNAVKNGGYLLEIDQETQTLANNIQNIGKQIVQTENELSDLGKAGLFIKDKIDSLPVTKFNAMLKSFGESPAGISLEAISHSMNAFTVAQSGVNVYNAATTDQSSGELDLTRSYGTAGSFAMLGLDIAAMVGNGLSGNYEAFFTDAAALTTGSIGDLFISIKGLNDINERTTEGYVLAKDLAMAKNAQILERRKKFADLVNEIDSDIAKIDEQNDRSQGIAESVIKQRADARSELARIEQEDQQLRDQTARDKAAQDAERKRKNEEYAGAQDRLEKDLEYDYPTAPPRDPNKVAAAKDPAVESLGQTTELSQAQLANIATEQRKQAAQSKLDAEQAERAKDLPPLDNFKTPEERQAFYQQQLDAAEAERAAGLPPLDNFKTPEERQAYYQQKLDESQAARAKDLPPIDNFKTPEERQAYYQQQLDAADAERASGLPPTDNFKTPEERQAFYQQQLNDVQTERTDGLPPIDQFKTPEERRIASQKILDEQQAERTKGLPTIDNFSSPEERRAANQKYLDESLKDRLAARNEEFVGPRDYSFRTTDLKVSDLTVTQYNLEPVVFKDVNFDEDNDLFDEDGNLRKVGPDDFVMTAFDAPDISEIAFSNFADDDYPGGNKVPAFGYESMSGTVETSLDKWEEWLIGQDVAKLERLARQAGYPNLASALNRAADLIRQADDDGYRKWAMSPPSCTGYIGCGPQYLERWSMRRSTLALGDILRGDRAFFSTSGLTDISIASLMFMFSIIDFGIDDGDRVNIAVSQFGRSLLNQSLTIKTSGTSFSVPVRPGVVTVNLTALNTGEFPPNTAALSIQGVTGGDSNQNYSLDEGGTAGLRVNVGGKP